VDASAGTPTPSTSHEQALERLRKLELVTEAALTHLALDELFEELLTRTRDILAADTCAVLLLEGDELVARAAKGLEEEVEQGVRIPLGQGFAGRVAAERRPVIIDDLNHAHVVNPLLREKGIKSMLGAPLIVSDRVLGVIHVGTLRARLFTPDDVELLELAADRIARGLEKALVHDELIRLDRLKSSFIALASHELRTPAAAVHGLAATLHHRHGELEPETVEELTRVLYEQSDRLARLTEQLLDLSRLDASEIEIKPERMRVRDAIEKLVRALGRHHADVRIDVPAELEVNADQLAFEHVLSNLLVNAVRYGAPPVAVSAEQRDRHFRLAVEDSGEGVPRDLVPHLFEWFQRGPIAREKGGSGLGLAIARAYAKAHGGELLYEPERRGARFVLVLPQS
jgi:signal transduction histidine kinase